MQFAIYPSLKEKGVLITGGASGIGAAMVSEFCAQGASVAFIDNDEAGSNALIHHIEEQGHHAPLFIPCDISNISSLKSAVAKADVFVKGIQVLVNNAGNDQRHQTLEVTESQWDGIMKINLDQQFFAAQAVIPGMVQQGGGSIINLSSSSFILAKNDDYIAYMTAKSAIVGLTRGLAREFGKDKIRVNSIMPGWVMTKKQIQKWLTPEAEIELLNGQALKEKLVSEDIARMALFLAADDSAMLSQQCVVLDGGRV